MKRSVLLWAGMLYFGLAGTAAAAFIDFGLAPFNTCTPANSCTRTVGGVEVTIEGWRDVNADSALDPLVDTPAPLWWDSTDGFGVDSISGEPDEVEGPEFLVVRFGNTQTISQLSITDLFYEGSPQYQEIGYYRLTVGGSTGGLVQFLADVSQVPSSTNGVKLLSLPNDYADNITFTAPGPQGSGVTHEFSVKGVNATSASANLAVSKSDSSDPVLVGQNLTYTITVSNAGPQTAHSVVVSDVLPGGVTLGTVTPSQGSCSGTSTITCALGTIASGANATVTIVVTPNSVGGLSNTASVTSSTSDPNTSNNSDTEGTTVSALSADLSITKSDSPDPVIVGQNLTYSITVTNNGPNTASNVVVTDTLPGSVNFVSASPSAGSCTPSSGTVTCNLGSLAFPGSATISIVVTPTTIGTISNSATVSSTTGDPNAGNNTAGPVNTTVNGSADLSITKSESADPILVGQPLTYTITVTNNGPTAAANVAVTDTLPGGVTFGSATPSQGACTGTSSVTCNLGTVPFPGSATVTIVVTPTGPGTLSNSASVTSSTNDPVPGNNNAGPITTTVNAPSANLSISKSDSPDPVTAGNQLTYSISVTNLGPNTATSVVVTDTLPGSVTWVSSTPSQGSCSGTSTVTCNLGSIPFPGSATVTIVVATTVAGPLSNTATVSSATNDPTPGNNSDTETTTVDPPPPTTADLSITKADSPDPVPQVGDPVTYTLTVTNLGPAAATGLTLTDTLPVGVTFVSASGPPGSCGTPSGGVFTCTLSSLAVSASWTVTVVVNTTLPGNIANSATVSAAQTDPNPANNSATETTNVGDVSRLINISTRANVGTGDNVMIGGFILGGNIPKTLLIRVRGPSLVEFGVAGSISNPSVELFSGPTVIARNDNWQTTDPLCLSPATACFNAAAIQATNLDPCDIATLGCTLDSVIMATLPPGPYTAIVRGVGNVTGVANIGVFDVDPTTLPKMVNISTRGQVLTGDSVMIGGFIIGAGTGNKTVLLRVRGPSLAAAGVAGPIANPYVELYSGPNKIAQNDNWQTTDPLCVGPAVSCGNATDIQNTGLDPCTITPTGCTLDSAILITLPPGPYTAIIRGVGGVTGVANIGIFDLAP